MGTAAALCARYKLTPRQLYENKKRLNELQQTLLRQDQTIKQMKNNDPHDLARKAHVRASASYKTSKPSNVIDGFVRNMEGELTHRWLGPMSQDGAWLELAWEEPQRIRHVQLTFDTGFHRELTLTSSDRHNDNMIRAPQPETVRDYRIVCQHNER